jgi:hypothetical protein
MNQNFEALGRYTAHKEAALNGWYAYSIALGNLGNDLKRAADDGNQCIDFARVRASLDRAEAGWHDAQASLARANVAALDCGQKPVSLYDVQRRSGP